MNFLHIKDINRQELDQIFRMADLLKKSSKAYLKGKTFVLFFPESSIRTRISFEKGIQDLGGTCIVFPPETLDKKEALKDVIRYMTNWADGVIVRHKHLDILEELSRDSSIPIINAMTGHNHPCEILGDLYGIRQRKGRFDVTYTFVGAENNISRTWLQAAEHFKFPLNHVCEPHRWMISDDAYYHFTEDLISVIGETDVVLTDGLHPDLKYSGYYQKYQITSEIMAQAKPGALLNPCPPFTRGEEVSNEVIESAYFVGHDFKRDLLYVQQAIILFCLGVTID